MTKSYSIRQFSSSAILLSMALCGTALMAPGQSSLETGKPVGAPAFEVVSIKPDSSECCRINLSIEPNGRFRGSGISMKLVLEQAYEVKDAQIIGAPGWLDSDRFEIEAKPDEATSEQMKSLTADQSKEKLMLMLRWLLMERCKLSIKQETRDLPVYSLVIGKNGPRFQEAARHSTETPSADAEGTPGQMRGGIRMGRGQVELNSAHMAQFVEVLSRNLRRPVVDNTGLTKEYSFSLKWTPDEHEGGMLKGAGDAVPASAADAASPSIFTAIQEQLGLKLESQKAPMAVVVIDHIEKPSPN